MKKKDHKMKHYAMMNAYASRTSDGFANTWYPVAFSSRKERNDAISSGINAARIMLPCERRVRIDAIAFADVHSRIIRD
jgi:hypothetical protein